MTSFNYGNLIQDTKWFDAYCEIVFLIILLSLWVIIPLLGANKSISYSNFSTTRNPQQQSNAFFGKLNHLLRQNCHLLYDSLLHSLYLGSRLERHSIRSNWYITLQVLMKHRSIRIWMPSVIILFSIETKLSSFIHSPNCKFQTTHHCSNQPEQGT